MDIESNGPLELPISQNIASSGNVEGTPSPSKLNDSPAVGHFSRAHVVPLPLHNPKGTHSRPGDLVKYYATPGMRYTGRPSDNQSLAMHQAAYYNQARICNLTAQQALDNMGTMMAPNSLASHFYFSEILNAVPTLEDAFEKLFQWDKHHSTIEGALRRWRSLHISSFKTASNSWSIAMEKLYERATLIQAQLDHIHKHPQHLIEVLQSDIRDQPFYLFVERTASVRSPQEYFHKCLDAIQKQEDLERFSRSRSVSVGAGLTSPTPVLSPNHVAHSAFASAATPVFKKEPHLPVQSNTPSLRQVFFSHAGRRYGNNNSFRGKKRFGSKNPFDKNGKRMRCRGCGSEEHFVADCTAANKAKMISLVTHHVGSDATALPLDYLFDIGQEIPPETWAHFDDKSIDESFRGRLRSYRC